MTTEPCRITDGIQYDTWEQEQADITMALRQETRERKYLDEVTLYDLMGEDHQVWLARNKATGYIMDIENESNEFIKETELHEAAIESLATFCRRFLWHYDRINHD